MINQSTRAKYCELIEQAEATLLASGDQQKITTISVCDEVLATLTEMEKNLLEGVNDGLINICKQISAEQTVEGTPERIVLERIAKATKGLTKAVADAFDDHRSIVQYQRDRFVLGKITDGCTK